MGKAHTEPMLLGTRHSDGRHLEGAVRISAGDVQRGRQQQHAAALADEGPADARPVGVVRRP